jgi:hypothetical protein
MTKRRLLLLACLLAVLFGLGCSDSRRAIPPDSSTMSFEIVKPLNAGKDDTEGAAK